MSDLLQHQYDLRGRLVADLRADLFGPDDERSEVIDDAPFSRYALGMLFPREDDFADADDHDEVDEGDENSSPDPGVARTAARRPSSCGMTFAVDPNRTERLTFTARAAQYIPCDASGEPLQFDPADRDLRSKSWLRRSLSLSPIEVELRPGDQRIGVAENLELFVRIRDAEENRPVAVTAVLMNIARAEKSQLSDLKTFFQVGLDVAAVDGQACFVERRLPSAIVDDEELASYDLLYRHTKTYAFGHGTSVRWETPADSEHAERIALDFCPTAEVNVAESNEEITSAALSMRFCADAPAADLGVALLELVDGYSAWVDGLEAQIPAVGPDHADAAARHVEACRQAARRLRGGVDLLSDDSAALDAFRLANDAMRIVRARTEWLRDGAKGAGPADDADGTWRAFQLAFILMCARGTADPTSDEREIADLLWFPTGGGKTEAYLGLVAFAIFHRRLTSADGGGGVTVIMRYTLRLLTIQQFARAALLISACEYLRSRRPGLGAAPITLGLWVGRAATPNDRAAARAAITLLKRGQEPTEGNPRQLQACPWCGSPLRPRHYSVRDAPPQMVVACGSDGCHFARGLPVHLVDEDVYDHRSTLLIATADKFAALPWNPRTRALFGFETQEAPPQLIIQDELHLISGPLGTLAGLYETAIDHLCDQAGARPKVIASTATVRRAGRQVEALFDRRMEQFPPAGLDARDSYFAVEAPPEKRGNRQFVGLMAPATSHTSLLVRTYARVLATAELSEEAPDVVDPYWTVLGYFNSLRVLGGARMQVQDDVRDRLKLIMGRATERHLEPVEMTSRIDSGAIPEHLEQMERRRGGESGEPLDVVLATNMISVGVDIDRLGLMAVMGQPQATAEYIQATSRVGRRHPGLILVLFNAARSRDRSHYEGFAGYHTALYRQVESTSVTPFASRARERALHAVFVGLCRATIPGLREEADAGAIAEHLDAARELRDLIVDRVRRVDPDSVEVTCAELDDLLERWRGRADAVHDLRYRDVRRPERALLVDAAGDTELGAFPTLYSLRDVDLESTLRVI